jgi:hypothetical protein
MAPQRRSQVTTKVRKSDQLLQESALQWLVGLVGLLGLGRAMLEPAPGLTRSGKLC